MENIQKKMKIKQNQILFPLNHPIDHFVDWAMDNSF